MPVGRSKRYQASSNDRWTLGFIVVGSVVAFIAARIPGIGEAPSLCPLYAMLGLHCPGCGLTRACLALTHFEIGAALRHNPMVVFIVGYACYLLIAIGMGLATGRRLPAWPRPVRRVLGGAFIAAWLVLAVVRTVTWVAPETNPGGFLIPQAFAAASDSD